MIHVDSDTLAYYKLNPFLNKVDFSGVRLKEVIPLIKASMQNEGYLHPEKCALEFYLLNHAYSLVASRFEPHEPLGDMLPICELYASTVCAFFRRLSHYMILITTRESRHAYSSEPFYKKLEAKFGPSYLEFHKSIRGSGSGSAVERFLAYPPDMTLGKYTEALVYTFYHGKYSKSYGGPVWGGIADALNQMVHGMISPEVMMDTAWTLSHNTGPIFNKGMLFHTQNNQILMKILDVQRSGQIPQLLNSDPYMVNTFGVDTHIPEVLRTLLPNDMAGEVDWFKVEALGALGSYYSEKQQQEKKQGDQPKPEVSKPEVDVKKVQITPSCYATILKRAA